MMTCKCMTRTIFTTKHPESLQQCWLVQGKSKILHQATQDEWQDGRIKYKIYLKSESYSWISHEYGCGCQILNRLSHPSTIWSKWVTNPAPHSRGKWNGSKNRWVQHLRGGTTETLAILHSSVSNHSRASSVNTCFIIIMHRLFVPGLYESPGLSL